MTGNKLPDFVLYISGCPKSKGHTYRVDNYISALSLAGVKAQWLAGDDAEMAARASKADLVIIFRTEWNDKLEELFKICRLNSIPIAFDIDDLLFDKTYIDPVYIDYLRVCGKKAIVQWRKRAELYRKTLLHADCALLTTESLREQVSSLNKQSFLLPNGLNEERIQFAQQIMGSQKPSAADGIVRIGYASGTPTHQHDFKSVVQPLVRIMTEHPSVKLIVVGNLDMNEFPELTPFQQRIEQRKLVPLGRLPEEIYRFDVNIAPLEINNPFCEAKSELKYFEAGLVGVPTVASATAPMIGAIIHGKTGYCAATENDWFDTLNDLLSSVDLREKIGLSAREHVLKQYGLDQQCATVCGILTEVLDGRVRY